MVPPPSPPLVQSTIKVEAFVLHGDTETKLHSIVALAPFVDHTIAHIDRIEQRIRSFDDLPVDMMTCQWQLRLLSFTC